MLNNTIKTIAKKIVSKGKGLFDITHISNSAISFRNTTNVFSFQIDNYPNKGSGLFRAGYVVEGTKQALTFESGYSKMGTIAIAQFIPFHESTTDNPDYILRNALHFTLN
jgi:hypothetical protein